MMSQIKLSYNLDISDKSSWLTVTAAPSVRASFAYVQELGDFHCGPGYYTLRENLPSYLIKLTVSGEGTLRYDGATYQLKPGRLFWVDCRRHQHYFTAPEAASGGRPVAARCPPATLTIVCRCLAGVDISSSAEIMLFIFATPTARSVRTPLSSSAARA